MATLFEQKKEELRKEVLDKTPAGKEPKRVFSKQGFNDLATAYMNSPEYVDSSVKSKDGQAVVVETTPVKEIRESIIGGIAKAAGLDKAESAKLVESYQFSPKTDWHSMVSNTIEAYAGDALRKFTFIPRADMKGSIEIKNVEKEVKEVRVPGADNVRKKVEYGAHRKVKVKSSCPSNLKKDC